MKIHILLPNNSNGPTGGGNQFLQGLKEEFIKKNIYTENIDIATIFLFNSHHHLDKISYIKYKYPNTKIFHRVDGLHQLWRGKEGVEIDLMVRYFSNYYANGVIFQSNWSKEMFKEKGIIINKNNVIIPNAPSTIFANHKTKGLKNKIELITTCWSPGLHKGIEYYMFLDKHLDFNKYNYTYVGQIPNGYKFKNIILKNPTDKNNLVNYLKKADIFVCGFKIDCASNSLSEALSCGLPALYLNCGGNPEIVKNGGVAFNNESEILEKLDFLVNNYKEYQNNINIPTISEIADKYINFFKSETG